VPRAGMAGLLQLARPINCVMSALGVGIGGVVAARSGAWGEFAGPLALAGAAAASFTAGGNALNDLYDREPDRAHHPHRPLPAGASAVSTAAGRESTKEITDVRGDVDRRTLPRRIGIRPAGWAAALSFVVGVLLSLAPLPLHVLSVAYAALVIPADGMFIYAALHSAANPARSQRVA